MSDRVACTQMADDSYRCTGKAGDYQARVTSDGERVVVRDAPPGRRSCRYGPCGNPYGGSGY